MDIPRLVTQGWEHRFPDTNSEWSHWLILGDGVPITLISGMDLIGALRTVRENFGKFSSIKVNRVKVDGSGNILEEEKALHEISNLFNDRMLIKQDEDYHS